MKPSFCDKILMMRVTFGARPIRKGIVIVSPPRSTSVALIPVVELLQTKTLTCGATREPGTSIESAPGYVTTARTVRDPPPRFV